MLTRSLLSALLVVAVLFGVSHAQSRWSWPEQAENLQVLPKDLGGQSLRSVMTGFTRALGVRCSHCHVGEEGQPLSTFDFESDANPNKDRAREMLRMVADIQTHLAKLEPSGEESVDVGCYTCHRGTARPMRLSDVLIGTWRGAGPDAAVDRYHELHQRYYGRGAYDFGEESLNVVGYAMLEAQEPEAAITFFRINSEMYPDSANAWDSLGEAQMKAGHTQQAIECYEKSLALDPKNDNAARMLEELRTH